MRGLLLLSGGVDSIAAARRLMAKGTPPVAALTVDYGQPAAYEEIVTSARWCRDNGIDHAMRRVELDATELGLGDYRAPRVVAGRNAVLLSIGVNVAAGLHADALVLGATHSDFGDYPDCREGFLGGLSRLFKDAYGVRVVAPLWDTPKNEAARLLTADDRAIAFSCYTPAGQLRHCGKCRSCIERAQALAAAEAA